MSSTTAQHPSAQDGSPKDSNRDGAQDSDELKLANSAQHKDEKSETPRPAQVETGTDQFRAMINSLRTPADRKCVHLISADGIYRVLHYLPTPPDQPTEYEIYDAKPMSPEMIKAYLDRKRWSQATEDKFRGVDGRTIPQEQWWNPPPGIVPPMGSKNERDERMRRYREKRDELEWRIARGECSAGEPVACNSIKSDYDLRPRQG